MKYIVILTLSGFAFAVSPSLFATPTLGNSAVVSNAQSIAEQSIADQSVAIKCKYKFRRDGSIRKIKCK